MFAGDFYRPTSPSAATSLSRDRSRLRPLRREASAGWGRRPPSRGWLLRCARALLHIRFGLVEPSDERHRAALLRPRPADAAATRPPRRPQLRAEDLISSTSCVTTSRMPNRQRRGPGAVESKPSTSTRCVARHRPPARGCDSIAYSGDFPCARSPRAQISALLHLRDLAPEPRGHTGSMGWIDPNGDAASTPHPQLSSLPTARPWPGSASARVLSRQLAADEWAECRLKGEFVPAPPTCRLIGHAPRPEERRCRAAPPLQRRAIGAARASPSTTTPRRKSSRPYLAEAPCSARLCCRRPSPWRSCQPLEDRVRPVEVKRAAAVDSSDARVRHKTPTALLTMRARQRCVRVGVHDPAGFLPKAASPHLRPTRRTLVNPAARAAPAPRHPARQHRTLSMRKKGSHPRRLADASLSHICAGCSRAARVSG